MNKLTQLQLNNILLLNQERNEDLWSNESSTPTYFRELKGKQAIFNHLDLSGLDFRQGDIQDAKFFNCDLSNAIFPQLVTGVEFIRCNMPSINFDDSSIGRIIMRSSNLAGCTFVKASISNCELTSCDLSNVDFTQARLYPQKPSNKIISCLLKDTNFSFAELDSVDFMFSRFINTNFSNSFLSNLNLTYTETDNPNLQDSTRYNLTSEDNILTKNIIQNNTVEDPIFQIVKRDLDIEHLTDCLQQITIE